MDRESIQSVTNTTVTNTSGKEFERIGNAIMIPNDAVWADGTVAYGNVSQGYTPPIFPQKPVGDIPLFFVYTEDGKRRHFIFDEKKMDVVRFDRLTESEIMVNSRNDFSFPKIDGAEYFDYDADMDDEGNVYAIFYGNYYKQYEAKQCRRKYVSTPRAIYHNSYVEQYSTEARPYDPNKNYSSSGSNTVNYGTFTYETWEKDDDVPEYEYGNLPYIWHNGKKTTFGKEYLSKCEAMWDDISGGHEDVWKTSASVTVQNVRINEKGKTNYVLLLALTGEALEPLDVYAPVINWNIDRGRRGYDAVPTGWHWGDEEIWSILKDHVWKNISGSAVGYEKVSTGHTLLHLSVEETYFVDENGNMTLLQKTKRTSADGFLATRESYISRYNIGTSAEYRAVDDVIYSRTSFLDSVWSIDYSNSQYAKISVPAEEETVDFEPSQQTTYKRQEDMRWMLQDGYKMDGYGNVYKDGENIVSCNKSLYVTAIEKINGGYLLGTNGSVNGPISTYIYNEKDKSMTLKGYGWRNTRLRHMKGIERWIKEES